MTNYDGSRMITYYPQKQNGHFKNNWLESYYHFSFNTYRNPQRMHFGPLRVVNDDKIKAGTGFDFHPHKNMEIITFVRRGAILHKDSLGNEGITHAGNIQVMSAGTGITHAEYATPEQDASLFQIWLFPREKNITPSWDQKEFQTDPVQKHLPLLASGRDKDRDQGGLYIHQNAAIYGGHIKQNQTITYQLQGTRAYVILSSGTVSLNDHRLAQGDSAAVKDEAQIQITALSEAELLVIDMD